MLHLLIQLLRENAILVVDEEAIGMVRWHGCRQLLEGPRCRGLSRDIGMQDFRVACSIMTKT